MDCYDVFKWLINLFILVVLEVSKYNESGSTIVYQNSCKKQDN